VVIGVWATDRDRKLRTRVRFSSPAPGLIWLPRLTEPLQILLLAFATVRHYSLLFATSHCRSTVATAIMAVNHGSSVRARSS